MWFQIACGKTNEHGFDTTWPLNDNESKRAEWIWPCQTLMKIENFQQPQRRSKKVFHKWNGEPTESFSSDEGDRQRSLKEYIMRITQGIQTEEWPRGCVFYLTLSSKAWSLWRNNILLKVTHNHVIKIQSIKRYKTPGGLYPTYPLALWFPSSRTPTDTN